MITSNKHSIYKILRSFASRKYWNSMGIVLPPPKNLTFHARTPLQVFTQKWIFLCAAFLSNLTQNMEYLIFRSRCCAQELHCGADKDHIVIIISAFTIVVVFTIFIIFVITIFIIMKKIIAIVIISAVTAMQCLRRWHHICSGASMLSIQTPDNWKGEESAEHRIYQNQVSRPLFLLMKCSVLEWKFHLGQKLAWNWDHASNPIFSNDFTLFERETLQPHRDQYQSKEREKLEFSIHFC